MKRFLSFALLALFSLVAYQAKADDEVYTTTSDGIEITLVGLESSSVSAVKFAHDPMMPNFNGGYHENEVQIVDAGGDVVAQGYTDGYDEDYSDTSWYDDQAVIFYLNNAVTDDGTYTLKVPAEFFTLGTNSNEPYSEAIEVTFTIGDAEEEAAITLVDPVPGADGTLTLEGWTGWFDDEDNPTVLKFKASDEVSSSDYTLYWALNIVDGAADEDYPYESYANYDSSTGLFSTEIFFTQTFYEGTTYELTACVKNSKSNATIIDEMTVLTIIGATPIDDDPRSTVSLVSSDPEYYDLNHYEIELESVQDLPVTLTFDGFVAITATINQSHVGDTYTGNSIGLNATGVTGTADTTGNYYTKWTFTIPASEIGDEDYGGSISVIIEGTDSIGKLLFDSSGYTSLVYSYTITGDVEADLTDYTFTPADSATVAELDSIVIANTNGIAISWYVESFNITDEDGEIVATISAKDDIVVNYESDEEPDENSGQKGDDSDDSWGNAYSVTITLPEAITDDGTYTVTIPSGFFVIGIGSVTTNSPKITLTYTVESTGNEDGEGEGSGSGEDEEGGDATGISAVNAAIANGAEVYNLAGQRIAAPVSGMVNVVKYADGTVKKVLVK